MKKMILLNTVLYKTGITLICISLTGISCTKEYSFEGIPPPETDITIFNSQIPDGIRGNDSTGGIELGVKFWSAVAGEIKGIRFYKTSGDAGTHIAQLYSSDGILLDSSTFINETDSGWQQAVFIHDFPIAANTTYVAAYYSSLGNYIFTHNGLKSAITHGPLTALADGTDGINGIFKYTNTPDLPDSGYLSSNYWVDVIEKIPNN
jgi:Domain of unknown function (DUF4082)